MVNNDITLIPAKIPCLENFDKALPAIKKSLGAAFKSPVYPFGIRFALMTILTFPFDLVYPLSMYLSGKHTATFSNIAATKRSWVYAGAK